MNVPFPLTATVGQGLFADPSTYGLVQGTAYPDPATYWALRGGILASTETLPLWGGIPIYQNVPGAAGGPLTALGPVMGRATTVTGGSKPIAGFSVFDQAYGMVVQPGQQVPMAGPGMQVMSYRLGSGARLAVQCDPLLVSLQGGAISAQVAWDFVNGVLVPYTGSINITSGTYNNTTGAVSLVMASAPGISVGDSFTLASLTGTGAYASLDGTWQATAGTTGTTVNFTAPSGLGATTITGGTLTTGAALPVTVLDVQSSNCMVVSYNATTGLANWNFNGAAAVIQI